MKLQHTSHTWCIPRIDRSYKGGLDVCNNCAIYQTNTPGTIRELHPGMFVSRAWRTKWKKIIQIQSRQCNLRLGN